MSLEKEYVEYIKDIIERLNASVLLYGSTACGKQTSDLDVALIVEDYSKEDFEELKAKTIQFQVDRNMTLDNEVPYENKLIYRDKEVKEMIKKPPFEMLKGAKYNIRPVQKNPKYMASDEMKARLLLNVLTSKSVVIAGDKSKIDRYKQQAWETIIKSIISHNNFQHFSFEQLIDALYTDKNTGMSGELYLGYKVNMPEKKECLLKECKSALDNLARSGKIKNNGSTYIANEVLFEKDIEIYKENLLKQLKSNMVDSKKTPINPRFVFVGGLPASGKTLLGQKISEEYPEEEFVIIDADNYREFCPNLQELKKEPKTTAITTGKFANEIEMELLKYALDSQKSIIQLSSFRATELMNKLARSIEKEYDKYSIEAVVMATQFDECLLSAQERYVSQVKSNNEFEVPRFVGIEFLKSAEKGCIQTLLEFENNHNFEFVRVYKRGNNKELPVLIYNSKDTPKKYRNSVEAFYDIQTQESKKTNPEEILTRCKSLQTQNLVGNASVTDSIINYLIDKYEKPLSANYIV